jgi:hypothetical protein
MGMKLQKNYHHNNVIGISVNHGCFRDEIGVNISNDINDLHVEFHMVIVTS